MEGNSNIRIHVWELRSPQRTARGTRTEKHEPKAWNQVYEEQADTTFPVRGRDASRDVGVSEACFQDSSFLKLVANELSWHFVEHEPGDDIQDVKFNGNIQ